MTNLVERQLAELLHYWLKRIKIADLSDADLQQFRDTHKIVDGVLKESNEIR